MHVNNLICLQVHFVGEEAVDEGGPKREFWRLLGLDIRDQMCAGDNDQLSPDHDVIGLQVCSHVASQLKCIY